MFVWIAVAYAMAWVLIAVFADQPVRLSTSTADPTAVLPEVPLRIKPMDLAHGVNPGPADDRPGQAARDHAGTVTASRSG